jgi:hypothetical protein
MDDSLFAVVILVVALLIALVPLSMIVKVVMRVYWVSRALTGGLRAEGRCVRIHTTQSTHHEDGHTRRSSTRHYVFEFEGRDGRSVRFEDMESPSTTIEGDYVTVAYLPERPEKAAVVRDGGRVPYARAVLTVVPLALFVAFAVWLGVTGFTDVRGFGSDF